jgi:hypothetical protein
MDLCALVLRHVFGVTPANYCWVGRWVCYLPQGIFAHASIAASSKKPLECAVGWISHYVIGSLYAVVLVALTSGWLMRPTLLPAVFFGVATVLVPFLVMHPAFGLGIAASKTPAPRQARLKSLVAHTTFGIGMYVCAVGLTYLRDRA